jgi:hypothetical protein
MATSSNEKENIPLTSKKPTESSMVRGGDDDKSESRIDFEFDTQKEIEVEMKLARLSNALMSCGLCYQTCGWQEQNIHEWANSRRAYISYGSLVYKEGPGYGGPRCGCCYSPPFHKTVPLSQIKQIVTTPPRPDACCCLACVANPLVNVNIDTPLHRGYELSIYGLKDVDSFIQTVERLRTQYVQTENTGFIYQNNNATKKRV